MTIELTDTEAMIVRAALRRYRDMLDSDIPTDHVQWTSIEIARTQAIIDKAAKL